jgi:hypothetical protein
VITGEIMIAAQAKQAFSQAGFALGPVNEFSCHSVNESALTPTPPGVSFPS